MRRVIFNIIMTVISPNAILKGVIMLKVVMKSAIMLIVMLRAKCC